jgi:hypothetical protein
MKRLMPVVLLLAAAILALQPVIHHHPLAPPAASERGTFSIATTIPCSICAIGADRVVVSAPAAVAPLVVVFVLVTIVTTAVSRDALIALPSRAPPVR